MNGLRAGWQQLPRVRVQASTTSASGASPAARTDVLDAIPLTDALCVPLSGRLRVQSADGLCLLLPAEDARQAYLMPDGDAALLILPQDGTRKRWLKQAVSFEHE